MKQIALLIIISVSLLSQGQDTISYNKRYRGGETALLVKDLDAFFAAGYTKPQALDVITNISAKVISNFANQLAINIPDEPFAEHSETLGYDSTNYR